MAIFRYIILIILTLWYSYGYAYQACQTSGGTDIKWNTSYATYYINTSGGPSGCLSAIQGGMNTWTNVSTSSFTFYYGGTTTSTAHGTNDGTNIVTFGGLGSGILAENSYWYYTSTGYLVDSDIKFNTNYPWGTTGSASVYDIQNIGTHEHGHSLCLKDLYSSADSEKTMYGHCSAGETKKRTLDNDDIAGIAYLYPAIPSCPDLYSWNGEEYVNNGFIYARCHCPESEFYQERLVTQPVVAQYNDNIVTFKIKEVDDEVSYINSVAMYYRNNGNEWTELDLISADHNSAGDVSEALKDKDDERVNTVPGDEILLTYLAPSGGVEGAEFKSISSGYYLWSAETWCEVLELGPDLNIHPGDTVTFSAKINNMSAYELPEDAVVYFNILIPGYSGSKVASVSAGRLASGNPEWFSCNWTVPADAPPGKYTYSASVYIGQTDITLKGIDQSNDSGDESEVTSVGSSCN